MLVFKEHEWYAKRDDTYEGTFTVHCDTAEEACAVADTWETMRESGVATNARCDKCDKPALVPDGLCRAHAEERAHVELMNFVSTLDRTTNAGAEKHRHRALCRLFALGLSPADLNPEAQEPKP